MNKDHTSKIASELNLKFKQVLATAKLLQDEATVPFIARYRKEATESLDEVEITKIRDRLNQLKELDKRRDVILKSLKERELLTDNLKEKIEAAKTITELEDMYLPYRPKKRTRASVAKEKGLESLARLVFSQENIDISDEAKKFLNKEKGVETKEDALSGARDIIAEWINEDKTAREKMRELYANQSVILSKIVSGKENEGSKYKDYFEWEELADKTPSHRILAMFRGENESYLKLDINPPEENALEILERHFVKGNNSASEQVKLAANDSYKRLLSLSMETELRMLLKERADKEAIKIFSDNLRQLLLAPPLGQKNVLAIDPGFRSGCKIVCLDKQGRLLHHETVYPNNSKKQEKDAEDRLLELCSKYNTEIIAVGNGTAGRETVGFAKNIKFKNNIPVFMVNESGASVYSASKTAREEFPDHDVTVRGSVSIGRRLIDPLSELVKIDPKSIGVGQYQHDVNQNLLKQNLDDVVLSCVNNVGVELNTSSKQLLTYVSGLGPKLAQSIVEHRNKNGPFKTREELKEVPRLGEKAFEQSAGFLRIHDGENPLDTSAVHPESYHIVNQMAEDLSCSVKELIVNPKIQEKLNIEKYLTDTVGLPTLEDIRAELNKPGRDPREKFEIFKFSDSIEKIEDIKPGMKLPGVITNVTAFGAFVDIGIQLDGLIHISEISDRFVKDPADILKVYQKVEVTVLDIDVVRKRINLSLRGEKPPIQKKKKGKIDENLQLNKLFEKFGKKK
jgi:uncharacterized protein